MQLLERRNANELRRQFGPLYEPLHHVIDAAFEEGAKRAEDGSLLTQGAPPENPLLIANRYVPRIGFSSPPREDWLPDNLVHAPASPTEKPPQRGRYLFGLDELTLMRVCVAPIGTALQLIGPIGGGKTFLLKYFRACLCVELNRIREKRPWILPIYLDCNIHRSSRERATSGVRFAAAEEGVQGEWYSTTVADVEDVQTHLAKATAEGLTYFANERRKTTRLENWPDWLSKRPFTCSLDDILDVLPIIEQHNDFRVVFMLDNLDRMDSAHQCAACFLAEVIVARGGYAIISMRGETRRHLSRALDNLVQSQINLESHDAAAEQRIIRAILKLRLGECRRRLRIALHDKPFLLGNVEVDVRDAEGVIGELLNTIVRKETLERLRILTNRNRRYLLEAVAFLLNYAPLPEELPAAMALGAIESDVMDKEQVERWRRDRYPFIRDGLMTGPYETFIPQQIDHCRWLGYMVNVFCNGRATVLCNWFVRLNVLYAAQNSQGRVLLVENLWSAWVDCCGLDKSAEKATYSIEFNQALASLIDAGMLETPSVFHVGHHSNVRGGWRIRITDLGVFYLNVCVTNFAYVRFAKDSIEWTEYPSWDVEPRRLKLAGDTVTGKDRAENVARTIELLGSYEKQWMRDRIRQGNGKRYCSLFTANTCSCSIYGAVASVMLKRIRKFDEVDVSVAVEILERTLAELTEEAGIAAGT